LSDERRQQAKGRKSQHRNGNPSSIESENNGFVKSSPGSPFTSAQRDRVAITYDKEASIPDSGRPEGRNRVRQRSEGLEVGAAAVP
jgi:hypothetical protein